MNFIINAFEGADLREKWLQALPEIRKHPGATVTIEPGEYVIGTDRSRESQRAVMTGEWGNCPEPIMFNPDYVYDIGLDMSGLQDVTIRAWGVKLMIDGFMEPVSIRFSRNVKLEGLTIDHVRKPYSCGIASGEAGGNRMTVRFFDRYPVEPGMPMPRFCLFDPYANRFVYYGEYWIRSRTMTAPQTFEMETDRPLPGNPEGMLFYAWHTYHSRPAVLIEESENVELRYVYIHSQPGMGVVAHRCENLTFEGIQVVPSAGEHMSTNTDATHITSCKGTVSFHGCVFEGQGDDSVNIHSYYHAVEQIDGAACRVVNRAPTGTHSQTPDLFDVGDRVELTDQSSLRAVSVHRVVDCTPDIPGRAMQLVLDPPLPAGSEGMTLIDVTRQPEFVFNGNFCRNHIARAILVKVKNARIEDNTIIDVVGTAIYVAAESWWYEGLCTTEKIRIHRNRISFCTRNNDCRKRGCAGICVTVDADKPNAKTHKDVEITDNIITCPDAEIGIYVSNTERVLAERNFVSVKETPVMIVDVPAGT